MPTIVCGLVLSGDVVLSHPESSDEPTLSLVSKCRHQYPKKIKYIVSNGKLDFLGCLCQRREISMAFVKPVKASLLAAVREVSKTSGCMVRLTLI